MDTQVVDNCPEKNCYKLDMKYDKPLEIIDSLKAKSTHCFEKIKVRVCLPKSLGNKQEFFFSLNASFPPYLWLDHGLIDLEILRHTFLEVLEVMFAIAHLHLSTNVTNYHIKGDTFPDVIVMLEIQFLEMTKEF